MNAKHVRWAFKSAGLDLPKARRRGGCQEWVWQAPLGKLLPYRSLPMSSIRVELWAAFEQRPVELFVYADAVGRRACFDDVSSAIRWVQARESMHYVPGADLFLRREVDRDFRLIQGGAA